MKNIDQNVDENEALGEEIGFIYQHITTTPTPTNNTDTQQHIRTTPTPTNNTDTQQNIRTTPTPTSSVCQEEQYIIMQLSRPISVGFVVSKAALIQTSSPST
jgi:hypothetical protein